MPRAARALRCWVVSNCHLIAFTRFRGHRPSRCQIGTRQAVAIWT